MLRYARHAAGVERLIVSMRHHGLVARNRAAEDLGPIDAAQRQRLERLLGPE